MRKIRFRAWSTVDERIVYWGEFFRHNMNNIFLNPKSCGYELMQFTGLHDKNGKEIYEGDVISVDFSDEETIYVELFTVYFDEMYHAWFTKFAGGEVGEWLYEYDGDCEVVGNIYDNPELVKP